MSCAFLMASGYTLKESVIRRCIGVELTYVTFKKSTSYCSSRPTRSLASHSATGYVLSSNSCILARDHSLRITSLGLIRPSPSSPEVMLCSKLYRSTIEWILSTARLKLLFDLVSTSYVEQRQTYPSRCQLKFALRRLLPREQQNEYGIFSGFTEMACSNKVLSVSNKLACTIVPCESLESNVKP